VEQDVVEATVLGAQAGQPQLIQLLFRQTRTHPGRREVRVKVAAVMMSNHGEALMAAARRGIGLAVAPSFMARRDLDAGLLEPVLLDWSLPEFGVFAVYPHRRFVSPKVRVLLERSWHISATERATHGGRNRFPRLWQCLRRVFARSSAQASMRANRQRDPRNAGSQSAPPAHSAQPVGKSRERRLCGAVRERPDLAGSDAPFVASDSAVST